MIISDIIIKWYLDHKRDLPWRNNRDPYRVWISEIILQQTRVEQGRSYYLRFMEAFPVLESLAEASLDRVLKLWEGLGYYSRARNMHHAACYIHTRLGGRFPVRYQDLLSLKGVGEYTAAAIASICFDEPVPLMDGNVCRVLSRLFGISEPVNRSSSRKVFRKAAASIMNLHKPGEHNQALMEFGSLCCVPANPDCLHCPLSQACYAFTHRKTGQLPVRETMKKIRKRFFHYLLVENNGMVWLNRRTGGEIWNMLYEFPLVETSGALTAEQFRQDVLQQGKWRETLEQLDAGIHHVSPEVSHRLTHQLITARFYHITSRNCPVFRSGRYLAVPLERLGDYAFPRLLVKYMRQQGWMD